MLFNSVEFIIFFPIVVLTYFLIPKRIKYLWLLVVSYYFYMSWNATYALLIAFSTLATYGTGLLVEHVQKKRTKQWIMVSCIVINFGILFFFKYFDFTIKNINQLLGTELNSPFSLLLPVGISFYTFQAIGYIVDVYRGEVKAEKNVFMYALFVSFFPQLVAGPIERSGKLLAQLREIGEKRTWNADKIISGFALMVWGLFQKMVIADRVSIFVDAVHEQLFASGTVELVLAAIGFSIQIYCDFAGYTAVAIGAARIMGIELMENFNAPYLAVGIGDFWRRWHISLSTWFRDYLYIPLGGSRCSKIRNYLNLMITFLVSGLWHGAAWNYVVWGGIHGIYQIIGKVFQPMRDKVKLLCRVNTTAFSYRLGQMIITFILTTFAWIFFRAESLTIAFQYLKRMFTAWNPWVLFGEDLYSIGLDRREVGILLAAILLLLAVDIISDWKKRNFGDLLLSQNLWFRWMVLIALTIVVMVYGEYGIHFDSAQFIYFTF